METRKGICVPLNGVGTLERNFNGAFRVMFNGFQTPYKPCLSMGLLKCGNQD